MGKNSPVLFGTSIIGVVEYVGYERSRVRLITDEKLVPSVRAVRGRENNRFLLEHVQTVLFTLERREDLLRPQQAHAVLSLLSSFLPDLEPNAKNYILPKARFLAVLLRSGARAVPY